MQNMTDEQLERELLYILGQHIGKARAVERWDLVEIVTGKYVPEPFRNDGNLDDRAIRLAVGRLRKQGHFIGDLGNGKGRYIVANEKEFWEFYSSYVKPIQERAEVARALKKAAIAKWPNALQPGLFDIDSVEASL